MGEMSTQVVWAQQESIAHPVVTSCHFCEEGVEDIEHLFFKCEFYCFVWAEIMKNFDSLQFDSLTLLMDFANTF